MPKITTLVLIADSDDEAHGRIDQEVRQIEHGLGLAEHPDQLVFEICHAATQLDLRRAIQQYQPRIIHFSGQAVCFEDGGGTDALATFFNPFSAQIQCVVLNACCSEIQAQAIAQHIEYVISINEAMDDQAAMPFIVAFYEHLSNGEDIKSAYKVAEAELDPFHLPEEYAPRLFHRKQAFVDQVLRSSGDIDKKSEVVSEKIREAEEKGQGKKGGRRGLGLTISGLVLVSGLAGLMFFQWDQVEPKIDKFLQWKSAPELHKIESRSTTKKNAQSIMRQNELALQLINRSTYAISGIMESLTGTGNEQVVREILEYNLTGLEQIYELAEEDAASQRKRSVNLTKIGNVWLDILGNTQKALAAYGQASKIFEHLAETDPSSAEAQRDLSVSYNKLGDVRKSLDDTEKALSRYQQSLEIRERLVKADPASVQAQRDLSVSYERLGDVQKGIDRTEEALSQYQLAVEIRERLAETDPSNVEIQRDLAVSYQKLGDMQFDFKNLEKAFEYYSKELRVAKSRVRLEPENMEAKRFLAVGYNKLSSVQENLGKKEEALILYQRALEIRELLAEADPANVQMQRDLSVSYNKLGDMQKKFDRNEKALGQYQQALEISKRLAEADPENIQAERVLAVSYARLGGTQESLGTMEEALILYQKALEISERLNEADPENAQAQRDLAVSYENVGRISMTLLERYSSKNKSEKMGRYQEQTAVIITKMLEKNLIDPTLFNSWAFHLWKQKKQKQAAKIYAKALNTSPEHLGLLSGDMELAWSQNDTARSWQRIRSLEQLLPPEEPLYSLVRFYAWLLAPEKTWQPVLAAAESAGEVKRLDWDFWATTQKIEQLSESEREAAMAFIAYFEKEITFEELRQDLERLRSPDTKQPL